MKAEWEGESTCVGGRLVDRPRSRWSIEDTELEKSKPHNPVTYTVDLTKTSLSSSRRKRQSDCPAEAMS